MIGLYHFLILSGVLFSLGVLGVLLRRNALVVLMAVELMLNAANLAVVAFVRYPMFGDGGIVNAQDYAAMTNGMTLVFLVMTVAAAEVGVGLAIVINLYRQKKSVNIEEANALKG
ncbi:MAG: NADH-quinone oxidoreductase subunit NuoK [bacterium]|nr:NADH-quinone oxidoreductase subunit NuoK [bacterium]